MKYQLQNYIKEIDQILQEGKVNQSLIEKHLMQIRFFQHERLVHLIVTALTAILFFLTLLYASLFPSLGSLLLLLLFLCLLCPYLFHYYILENGVQKMYKQYFEMEEKKEHKK